MPSAYEQSIKGRYKSLRLPWSPLLRGVLALFYCIGVFIADTIIDCILAIIAALNYIFFLMIVSLSALVYIACGFSSQKTVKDKYLGDAIHVYYVCTKIAVLAIPTITQWAFACLSLVNIIVAIHCTLDFILDSPPGYSDKDNHYKGLFTHYLTIGNHYCQRLFPKSNLSTLRSTRQKPKPARRLNEDRTHNNRGTAHNETMRTRTSLMDPVTATAYPVTDYSTGNVPMANAHYLQA